jgi:ABC-type Fe3+/spermidine/putrescine transport system ATPase subunit
VTVTRDSHDVDAPIASASGHPVRITGASKYYSGVPALDGVDLDVPAGRFTVLLGPSGSGKTTLVRCIAGIERLDDGSIHFGERLISDGRHSTPAERRDLAMVFQDYALWPHLTVRQNVEYSLRRHRGSPATRTPRVDEALERVGLDGYGGRYPHELSGGQQQRVALARAVVGRPSLLLFDEPLSNLDADLRERLRVEIATLTRETGATAIYITHDQAEAFALADEIGVLRSGRLVQRGTPEEIYREPASEFVAQFTGVSGSFDGIAAGERDGFMRVRVGDHELPTRSSVPIETGSFATLLVRPTASSLVAFGAGDEDGIPASIVDVAYRGRGYDHVVETPYGRLTSVFDASPWTRGARCRLRLDPAGCLAFPA